MTAPWPNSISPPQEYTVCLAALLFHNQGRGTSGCGIFLNREGTDNVQNLHFIYLLCAVSWELSWSTASSKPDRISCNVSAVARGSGEKPVDGFVCLVGFGCR